MLKFLSPSKWNSYGGFNFEHCLIWSRGADALNGRKHFGLQVMTTGENLWRGCVSSACMVTLELRILRLKMEVKLRQQLHWRISRNIIKKFTTVPDDAKLLWSNGRPPDSKLTEPDSPPWRTRWASDAAKASAKAPSLKLGRQAQKHFSSKQINWRAWWWPIFLCTYRHQSVSAHYKAPAGGTQFSSLKSLGPVDQHSFLAQFRYGSSPE